METLLKRFGFVIALVAALVLVALGTQVALAKPCDSSISKTVVPGHCGRTGTVVGHYTFLDAYDAIGGWYQELADGSIRGSVDSLAKLDQATLTVCRYVVNYRGDFGLDPYLDNGWIQNHIKCSGFADNNTYNYLIVHNTDPRYTGNPAWAIWGTWEFHALTVSGFGNLVRPEHPVGKK